MNSEKMKGCLVFKGYKDENKNDRAQISFKDNEIGLADLPIGKRLHYAPAQGPSEHRTGKMDQNIYKVRRILEKTNNVEVVKDEQLT